MQWGGEDETIDCSRTAKGGGERRRDGEEEGGYTSRERGSSG